MSSLLMVNLNLISKHIKCFDGHKNLCRLRKYFYSSYMPPIRPSKSFREAKYIAKDKIPDGFRIIYRAPMENYLIACKNITTISSVLISLLAGYKYVSESNFMHYIPYQIKFEIDFTDLQTSDSDLRVFALGFILITVALRVIISKYPLRIYKNDTKYIGIFEGQLPLKYKRIEFQKGEVKEHRGIYFNPWKGSMYKIKNKSSLLIPDYFKTPSELYQMLE